MKLPSVGDTIGSKYRLDHVIGRGGFATVYRATDTRIDRQVAVKVLTPGEHGYKVATATRFQREARALASLSDSHTIRMFDFGRTSDGVLYMVFELLGGLDLSQQLSVTRTMDEDSTVHIVEQVLASLREAHAVGILHRDIKPGNIRIYEYMDDPLAVKLMDFGIVRLMDPEAESLTGTGLVVGTVRYMSPEQMKGQKLTPASDIFTLGLVAYEILTGDKRGALELIGGGDELQVPASAPVARIINKMLKKDPAERFRSAEDVLAAIATRDRVDASTSNAAVRTFDADLSADEDLPPTTEDPSPLAPNRERLSELPPPPEDSDPITGQAMIVGGLVILVTLGAAAAMLVTLNTESSAPAPTEETAPKPRAASALLRSHSPPDPKQAEQKPPTATAASSGCGSKPAKLGVLKRSSKLLGLHREKWRTYIPTSYDPDKRHPLLVFFHPDGSTVTEGLRSQRLRPFADQHGFLIAAPMTDGKIIKFRDGVDAEFIEAMVAESRSEFCIDDSKVFAFGVGGGGGGVESVSCEDWVVATATTSWRYNTLNDECEGRRPVPTLYYAPLRSDHLPIHGGLTCGGYEKLVSLADHEALWKTRNECGDPRTTWREHEKSVCYTWGCATPFVSCHIDGGHTWKGVHRDVDLLKCDGPGADFPHLKVMWDFFEEAARAGTPRPDDQ